MTPAALSAQAEGGATFSRPVPNRAPPGFPGLYCMMAFYRQESPIHRWKVYQRIPSTGPVGLKLTTVSENRDERGSITATLRDDVGLKTITVVHDGIGERTQTLSLSLTPGKVYELVLERREPAVPPPLHHYRLTPLFPGLELGWSDSLQSLEPVSSWSFNSDDDETARLRLFVDSPPPFNVPQATQVVYSIARPTGGLLIRDMTVTSLPAEIAVPPDVSPAKIINLRANGHFRMEKISGSDRGLYATPCLPQPGHSVPPGPVSAQRVPPGGQVLGPGPGGLVIAGQDQSADDGDSVPMALIVGGSLAVLLAFFGAWMYFTRRTTVAIQASAGTAATVATPPSATSATIVQTGPERSLSSGASPSTQMIGTVTPSIPVPEAPPSLEPPALPRAAVPDAELTKAPPSGLSMREVEVVNLIAKGYTNKQIAQELSISDATAKRHIENILRKLGLSSRTQVAIWATQNGYGDGGKPKLGA
ncbi:MAG: hypothetical protein FJ039_02575 [Chloroflexi bacterium]|nr:hypothetical protein [Chloroflexota bacterium]